MHGSQTLSDEEKREMLLDAQDPRRARAFFAARRLSQSGSLDDYLDFLSENIELVASASPRPRMTKDFRL
jgi:hypothetical protein